MEPSPSEAVSRSSSTLWLIAGAAVVLVAGGFVLRRTAG
jgi:hypothetical protein